MGDPVEVLRGDGVDHVDVAGEQGGDAGGSVADDVELHVSEVVLGLVPPIRVGLEVGTAIGLAVGEDERAGAVGVAGGEVFFELGEVGGVDGVVRLAPGLAHDDPGRDLFEKDRVDDFEVEVDRVVVNLGDVLDGLEVAGELAARADGALVAEHDVIGGEGLAALEFDALRRLKRQVVGVGLDQEVARAGSTLRLRSRRTRGS